LLLSQKSFASLGAYGDKLVLGVVLVAVLCLCPRGLASLWPRRRVAIVADEPAKPSQLRFPSPPRADGIAHRP
jgi:branched-chain amino acid transport system permease protein